MSFQSYASFKGKTQGTLKGESLKAGRRDKWTELVAFQMGSEAPVDFDAGAAKGARKHQPVIITKENGAASPQLLNAHWNSEIFDEIVVELVGRPSSGAGEVVVQRITLTNAVVSRFKQYFASVGDVVGPGGAKGPGGSGGGSGRFLTDFIFDYEKIEFRRY